LRKGKNDQILLNSTSKLKEIESKIFFFIILFELRFFFL
jgi:hypothetical protein